MPSVMRVEGRLPGTPAQNMKLSVIIPAYNEVDTIGPCLERVAAAIPEVEKEIIIVDD